MRVVVSPRYGTLSRPCVQAKRAAKRAKKKTQAQPAPAAAAPAAPTRPAGVPSFDLAAPCVTVRLSQAPPRPPPPRRHRRPPSSPRPRPPRRSQVGGRCCWPAAPWRCWPPCVSRAPRVPVNEAHGLSACCPCRLRVRRLRLHLTRRRGAAQQGQLHFLRAELRRRRPRPHPNRRRLRRADRQPSLAATRRAPRAAYAGLPSADCRHGGGGALSPAGVSLTAPYACLSTATAAWRVSRRTSSRWVNSGDALWRGRAGAAMLLRMRARVGPHVRFIQTLVPTRRPCNAPGGADISAFLLQYMGRKTMGCAYSSVVIMKTGA